MAKRDLSGAVTLNYTVRAVEGYPPVSACAEWAFWEHEPGLWIAGRFAYAKGKTKTEAKRNLISNLEHQILGLKHTVAALKSGKKLPEGIK